MRHAIGLLLLSVGAGCGASPGVEVDAGLDANPGVDAAADASVLPADAETDTDASGVIHHSDCGSPYGADDYISALDVHGMVRSMSRKGDCGDSAVAESFFASVEHEFRGRRAQGMRRCGHT